MVTKELLQNPVLSFPETTEEPHFEKTAFRIRKKTFFRYFKKPVKFSLFLFQKLGEKGENV